MSVLFLRGAAALCSKRADVDCQCSLPVTRTVGTQLSEQRLIYRRSLGVCVFSQKTVDSSLFEHVNPSITFFETV